MTSNIDTFRFSEFGEPSVLAFKAETLGEPGRGEIQIRHLAIGVNYIDIYHRRGSAPLPLPSGIGVENCWKVWLSAERRVCVGSRLAIFDSAERRAAGDPALRKSARPYLRRNRTVAVSQAS